MPVHDAKSWYFSSESVTEGHPDKLCDQISDAILDALIAQDPQARVACEVVANTGMVFIMGEISTSASCDAVAIARDVIREVGYTQPDAGFSADACAILTSLQGQSPDIARGVAQSYECRNGEADADLQLGAGDQGMVIGYACRDTDSYMPLAIVLAHRLCQRLAEVRKSGRLPALRPDGKAQVTVRYEGQEAVAVDCIVLSSQHAADADPAALREALQREVIDPVIPATMRDPGCRIHINPTGRFVVGGPVADSGLTGRKIIVDTYGGMACHGGGAFSGKDPSKVDRSGAYAARYVAKQLVAAGLASRCQVQLAYSIGVARPVSIHVDSYGTSLLGDHALEEIVRREFTLTPAAIICDLQLQRPIYRQLASYGHFGRDELDLPWERLDRVDELRRYLNWNGRVSA